MARCLVTVAAASNSIIPASLRCYWGRRCRCDGAATLRRTSNCHGCTGSSNRNRSRCCARRGGISDCSCRRLASRQSRAEWCAANATWNAKTEHLGTTTPRAIDSSRIPERPARIGALICGIESAKQLLYIYSPGRPTGSAHSRHIIDILHAVFVTGWTAVFAACGEAREARRAASWLISSTAHRRIRRAAGWFSQGEAAGKIAVCSLCKTERPECRCQRHEQHLGGEWLFAMRIFNFAVAYVGGKIRRLLGNTNRTNTPWDRACTVQHSQSATKNVFLQLCNRGM